MRFRLIRALGQGAEGQALLVEDALLPGGPVVAKVLDAPAEEPAVRESLRLVAGLHHPYLNPLLAVGRCRPGDGLPGPPGAWYALSPWVGGPDLRAAAAGRPLSHRLALLLRLARVLAHLHGAGVLHGDVKPENALLTGHGGDAELRLIDLGFASRRTATDSGPTRGSLPYLAPERLRGGPVTVAAELYAFGVTAFAVLAERLPVPPEGPDGGVAARLDADAPPIAAACAGCPAALAALVDGLLRRDPAARPATADEVVAGFDTALAALAAERAAAEAERLAAGLARTPFLVGRADECARLAALLAPGPGLRLVRLVGGRGSGRTRLLREARLQASLAGREVVSVEGAAGAGPAFFDLLAQRAGAAPGPAGDPVARLDAALAALSAGMARGPLALLVDDAQLVAPELEALLRLLPDATPAGADLAAVLATTPGAAPSGPHGDEIPVRPLPPAAVGRWIACCGHEPSPALVRTVVERTGGVPSGVRALLGRLAAADPVRLAAGELPAAPGPADELARSPEEARLRALVTLFGAPVDAERLGALTGRSATEAGVRLRALAVDGLFVPAATPGTLRLSEPLDEAALTALLGADEQRRVRVQAIALLDEGKPDEAAARVRHLAALGQGEAALSAALALADRPEVDPRTAREALRAVAALTGLPPARGRALALRIAAAERALGAYEAARDVLAGALAHTRSPEERAELLMALGTVLADRGETQEGVAALEEARRLAREPGRAARATAELAKLRLSEGDYPAVVRLADEGLAAEGPDEPLRADLLRVRAMASSYLDRHDDAVRDLTVALALDRRRGDRAAQARSLNCSAIAAFRRGRLDDALTAYEAALQAAEEAGVHGLRPQLLLNLASLHHQRGELGRAYAGYQRGLRLARALGAAPTEIVLLCDLALLHVSLGEAGEAARLAAAAEQRAAAADMRFLAFVARAAAGVAAAAAGQYEEANRLLRGAREGFAAAGAAREVTETTLHLAEVELRLGRTEAAREWLGAAAPAEADRALRSWWLRLHGELDALGDGADRVRAIDRLERAHRLAGESGALEERFRATLALARLHRDAGQTFLAARRYAEAREDLERMAVALPEPLRASFRATREHAEVRAATAEPPADGVGAGGSEPGGRAPSDEAERLYRLLELNRQILSDLSLQAVLEAALDAGISLTGAERGFIILREPGRDGSEEMRVRVARNIDRERVGHAQEKFSRTIAETVLESGVPLLTLSAGDDERLEGARSVLSLRLQSVACLPIRTRGGVRGVIYLDNRWQRGRFSERDERLLTVFADQVGVALENARMVAALERQAAELRAAKEALERQSAAQAAALEAQDAEVHRMKGLIRAGGGARALAGRFPAIIGESERLLAVLDTVERVARADLPVLVTGESGTGKELVARALHQRSHRRKGPFLTVNCGAIPEGLLETELFGHTRGAFTGAVSAAQGLFRAAQGGTVFLDEVGELPLGLQVKLLRALQERCVRPVGGTADIPVDVRFVAATNRNLREAVAAGRFREDLYYRLAGVELEVPPLRARREDIPPLVHHFLGRLAQEPGFPTRSLDARALGALTRYDWPGNVRELENVLRAACVLAETDVIRVSDLPPEIVSGAPVTGPARPPAATETEFREDEKRRILRALETHGWSRARAARALGMSRSTFYRRMEDYGIG